jgi:hypothetical protein
MKLKTYRQITSATTATLLADPVICGDLVIQKIVTNET